MFCVQKALKHSQAQVVTDLHAAAFAGDADTCASLITKGAPINASDYDLRTALVRRTPLHCSDASC